MAVTPKYIILDSTPIGLILQRKNLPLAEACREWLRDKLTEGRRLVLPEIIDYENRRELLRLKNDRSLRDLDLFGTAEPDRYLPLTSAALKLAAQLWADARLGGYATASDKALDVDVILAAQALTSGLPATDFIVATSNLRHLSLFVPSELWPKI